MNVSYAALIILRILLFFLLAGTYSNVIVSVIFGFLNFVLWLGSVWFVFKETKFFKNRTAQQYPQQNNFANITDPYLQQQTRVPGT